MDDAQQQFKQQFGAMITLGLRGQSARIRNKWEPEIVSQLGAIANLCLPLLPQVQVSQDDQASPAALSTTDIGKLIAPTIAQRTEVVKGLLRDMVRLEAGTLGQILTVNGLVAPIPKLEDLNPDIDAAVEDLAGTKVLDAYVSKSFVEFVQKVTLWYQTTAQRGTGPDAVNQGVAYLAGQWQNRLALIARTAVHAVANRTKLTISEMLSRTA